MKRNKIHLLILIILLFVGAFLKTINAQTGSEFVVSQQDSIKPQEKTLEVTFECDSCEVKNKFEISGLENFKFKKVVFPLKVKLKTGSYKMTYWQNKVQQIHLPFSVKTGVSNHIVVKK